MQDSYSGTTAKILSGTNGSTTEDYNGRALMKAVDTGCFPDKGSTASNILRLIGLAGLSNSQTDTYTLSASYDSKGLKVTDLRKGLIGLCKRDADGNWVNAVDLNTGRGR